MKQNVFNVFAYAILLESKTLNTVGLVFENFDGRLLFTYCLPCLSVYSDILYFYFPFCFYHGRCIKVPGFRYNETGIA